MAQHAVASGFIYDEVGRQHSFNSRRVPSVTQIMGGFTWFGQFKESDDTPYQIEVARQRGTYVHQLCEGHDMGMRCLDIIPECVGYFDGWLRFLDETGMEFSAIELPAISLDRSHCGKIDRIATDGRVVEIKTGSSVGELAFVQAYAYQAMIDQGIDIVRGPPIVIQLTGDGNWQSIRAKESRSYYANVFESMRALSVFGSTLKRGEWCG